MEELIEWLESLEIQTLTDELKSDILEKVQDLYDNAYDEAYLEGKEQAKFEISEYIKTM
jgi:flagellar biosynthesis/type III secretory pathway protein FliH